MSVPTTKTDCNLTSQSNEESCLVNSVTKPPPWPMTDQPDNPRPPAPLDPRHDPDQPNPEPVAPSKEGPNKLWEFIVEHADELGSLVRGKAKRFGVNPNDIDDIVQQTFIAALTIKKGTAHSITNLQGWFVRVGQRKCVDARRSGKKRIHVQIPFKLAYLDQETDPIERSETIAIVRAAVARLRSIERRLVIYCNLQGHTYAKAAERFAMSKHAVRCALVRGRKSLRLKLKADFSQKSERIEGVETTLIVDGEEKNNAKMQA